MTSARPPPSVQRVQCGRPPTAAQPEAESAAPPQRGEHKRRGPAPHLAAPDVQEGAEEGAVRSRLPLPVDTRLTIAETDGPATAEWRSLRLTGRAEGLAGRVPSESSRTSTRHEQARSEGGSGAERRERPSRERDNVTNGNVGAIHAGRGRRGAERGSSRRDSFAGAAGAGRASPTTPDRGTGLQQEP